MRYPHHHAGRIVFTYLGDIWTANESGQDVRLITVHRARDVYPRFSPDGYRFDDPKMHGHDWNAMKVKYEPLVAHVGDRQERLNIINEMIGIPARRPAPGDAARAVRLRAIWGSISLPTPRPAATR